MAKKYQYRFSPNSKILVPAQIRRAQDDAIKVGGVMSFLGVLLYMYGRRKVNSIQEQIAKLDVGGVVPPAAAK